MKTNDKLIGAGVFSAITASLCCITPVLALLAGTSGLASTFSWLEPLRPYFIGLTILVLVFAWYLKWKSLKKIDCTCETEKKPKFIHSKTFLAMVSIFAMMMLTFPYYSGVFYTKSEKQIIVVNKEDSKKIEYIIEGMTCTSCAEHVNHEVNKLLGILTVKASYEKGNAIIEYDASKTNSAVIENTINATGYTVTGKKEN